MDIKEAKKIIKTYEVCISKGTEGETILRKISYLSYSKAKIKYAYFIFLEDVIEKEGHLSPNLRKKLTASYLLLDSFVDDSMADKYIKIYQNWQSKKSNPNKNKKDERLIKQYLAYTSTLKGESLFNEINDYIEELLSKK